MNRFLSYLRSLGRDYPWYLCLFWGFFVLYHSKVAVWFFDWGVGISVILVGCLLSVGLTFLLSRWTDPWPRAALMVTISLFLFLFYGYLYYGLAFQTSWFSWMRHRYLIPLLGLSWIAMMFLLVRSRREMKTLTRYLNSLFLLLVLWEGGLTILNLIRSRDWWQSVHEKYIYQNAMKTESKDTYPDIYHLMLDAHTSIASLDRYWGYRDTSFVAGLRERGFFVAEQARSGYADTDNSMSAVFALDYVPDWMALTQNGPQASSIGRRAIRYGKQIQILHEAGYQIRNLSPFDLRENKALYHMTFLNLNHTLQQLSFTNLYTYAFYLVGQQQYYRHTEAMIDSLQRKKQSLGPTYTYAHFFMPHQPFYYDRYGTFYPQEIPNLSPKEAYLEQTIYTQQLILETIDSLRHHAGPEAIILLHGDHGFRNLELQDKAEDLTTLFAVYLPSQEYGMLDDSLNIVNGFRILNHEVFGDPLELLPHREVRGIR